jgi:hypothetical protein
MLFILNMPACTPGAQPITTCLHTWGTANHHLPAHLGHSQSPLAVPDHRPFKPKLGTSKWCTRPSQN